MELSISNIAWPAEHTGEMLEMVKRLGCDAIEVAPSRIWEEPSQATREDAKGFLNRVKKAGLSIVALHSLLYTRKDLGLFRDKDTELATAAYIEKLVYLASFLGARYLVFGSPENRRKGDLSAEEALERAADFFSKPANLAEQLGVCIVIEPLSEQETDFITDSSQGLRLVTMVNSRGFGLHLDAKSIFTEAMPYKRVFTEMAPLAKHFHINDPGLIEVGSVAKYHEAFGAALRETGYSGCVSIEMRTLPDFRKVIERSIGVAKRCYIERPK